MKSIDSIAATCGTTCRPDIASAIPVADAQDDWRGKVVVSFKDGTHHWVRWTTLDGLYCWLHPLENRWVFEPDQVRMPDFASYPDALAGLALAPRPPQ